eukprot:scaffold2107_cov127-Isochrysis_galbana.AAC.2
MPQQVSASSCTSEAASVGQPVWMPEGGDTSSTQPRIPTQYATREDAILTVNSLGGQVTMRAAKVLVDPSLARKRFIQNAKDTVAMAGSSHHAVPHGD